MIRRFAAVCAAVACLFAVSSCGDDGSKPSGEGSVVPSYANGNDEHGAEQFASYWVDTLNKATVSGKTEKLKALGTKDCTRCTDFAAQLDKIYAAGGHVETNGWKVQTVIPERGLPKELTGLSMKVQVAPQSVVKQDGADAEQHEGGALTVRMILTRSDDHWVVKSLDI